MHHNELIPKPTDWTSFQKQENKNKREGYFIDRTKKLDCDDVGKQKIYPSNDLS